MLAVIYSWEVCACVTCVRVCVSGTGRTQRATGDIRIKRRGPRGADPAVRLSRKAAFGEETD